MQMSTKPTTEDWQQLYQAAIDFKKAKCWEWMYDTDIFGVMDPETGETGYCCIMGNAGEHYGIAAYLGPVGLDGYFRIISGDIPPEDPDSMFIQRCLMCSFENRDMLAPEDLKVIKGLGLKFRGRNEWPLFRHYEPGLFPWFLDSGQVRFLTHILRQALDVSLKCRENREILYHKGPSKFFVRTPETAANDEYVWEDRYLAVKRPQQKYVSFQINNQIQVKKLKSIKPRQNLVLEVDTFFLPVPVKERGRPFYPKACMIVNRRDGMIVSYDMFQDIKKEGFKCIEMLTAFIEKTGMKPSTLLVARKEAYYLFSEACGQLDIKLNMTDRLVCLEEAKYDVMGMFQDRM